MGEAMTVMEVEAAIAENEAAFSPDIHWRCRFLYACSFIVFHPQFSHAITQYFLLATLPRNDGPSILFNALTALN